MNPILDKLELCGIIPVVIIDDESLAEPLAEALVAGGLSTMEITFRTDAAQRAMASIGRGNSELIVGAGTVLTVDHVKSAVDNGAQYIVSPGLNRKVVEYCLSNDITVTPGIATPTDIEAAIELGLSVVKFFPAEANGGLEYLKAICAPYKQMRFIPTGGIDEANLLSYLQFPPVLACGGSWMVKADLIRAKKFEEIRQITERAVSTMLGFQLTHVGINNPGPEEAARGADALAGILRMDVVDQLTSLLVGAQFEFIKQKGPGSHGQFAIGTNFIDRAVAQFSRAGIRFREDTRVEKNGNLASIYLEKEIGGFAVQILQCS